MRRRNHERRPKMTQMETTSKERKYVKWMNGKGQLAIRETGQVVGTCLSWRSGLSWTTNVTTSTTSYTYSHIYSQPLQKFNKAIHGCALFTLAVFLSV
ncbi:hypothetical protein E2C01_063964 [Portunus trituberculatus]|uniref:Uncharacterized protein n=1 Tax=Portunus trituberculatus TaxID=210409 RepID=A0A5B7HHV0_PORTR|nr:hypothetical protein [Portunus trituberculatus]